MTNSFYKEHEESFYGIQTHAEGPSGKLLITANELRESPSGNLFGLTQAAGMGWEPNQLTGDDVMILSTLGGLRDKDGKPTALGLHTGHFELGDLVATASNSFAESGDVPYSTYVSDPCDGRSQGTVGMFDSLPYRNDAAIVMRRLIRSLPTRKAVMGIASCDKGLPAMMMALAAQHSTPTILVPGGTTRQATKNEDAGTVQTIGVRFATGEIDLDYAQEVGCKACASSGGGCQFMGTAATSQVVGEALGLALPHSALSVSGEPIWRDIAASSATALHALKEQGIVTSDILTEKAIENAMIIHAAFGGSTNLLLHLAAICHAAGLPIPTVDDWSRINKMVPRIVSAMPIGPVMFPTGVVFLAGGVPEAMLKLRSLNILHEDVMTVTGQTLRENLDWWETSDRRKQVQKRLIEKNKVQPGDVIMDVEIARKRGLTSTVTFPTGNIAPQGSVVKSTAIDKSLIDSNGVYFHRGPAKVFTSEKLAIAAVKNGAIAAGDVMVIAGVGPKGTGMEETYQLTSALKQVPYGKHVALLTDARFSGVSTGACFGHVGPEGLAGGPIGKLRDGDVIEIRVDTRKLEGSINFVGTDGQASYLEGAQILESREPIETMSPDPDLPDDTRLWAALQDVSGGMWRGCVFDVDKIIETLEAGKAALAGARDNYVRN